VRGFSDWPSGTARESGDEVTALQQAGDAVKAFLNGRLAEARCWSAPGRGGIVGPGRGTEIFSQEQ
jgi:hypothetical protein